FLLNDLYTFVSDSISKISGCFIADSIPNTPNTLNHMKLIRTGTSITPPMNSRTVRPLDTRAINTPTTGLQLIHQANWKNVQSDIQSAFCELNIPVSKLICRNVCKKLPVVVVNAFNISIDGPIISTAINNKPAILMFTLLKI